MNRKIAFRAWDTVVKTMIYPETKTIVGADYLFIRRDGSIKLMTDEDGGKDGLHEHDISYPEGRFILLQFTGLKDRMGKEIYEGDIVSQRKNSGAKFKVFWNNDGSWMVKEIGKYGFGWDTLWRWCKVSEIIGNIWENPKLLK